MVGVIAADDEVVAHAGSGQPWALVSLSAAVPVTKAAGSGLSAGTVRLNPRLLASIPLPRT